MRSKLHHYPGETMVVQYDVIRCIHAEECINRLSAVFDKHKRPWVQPAQAAPDALADTIEHCPSGALHYTRTDGGAPEAAPDENLVLLVDDGPLYVHGQVTIADDNGTSLLADTRVALCRCDASNNKPMCDNSHKQMNFKAPDYRTPVQPGEALPKGGLTIHPMPNASLHLTGAFRILNANNHVLFQGVEAWLCRCGGSGDKPFCDGTHERIGFVAE